MVGASRSVVGDERSQGCKCAALCRFHFKQGACPGPGCWVRVAAQHGELFAVLYAVPCRSLCGCVPSVSGVHLSLRLLSCTHLQEPHTACPCALAPLTVLCLPLALSRHCSCAHAPQPALTRLCLRSRLCPSPSLCSISLRYSEWYPIWSAATLGKLFEPAAWQRRAYVPNGKLCFRAEILAVD